MDSSLSELAMAAAQSLLQLSKQLHGLLTKRLKMSWKPSKPGQILADKCVRMHLQFRR